MRNIKLTEQELYMKEGHSSKGNQLKFRDDDYWIKTDYLGYEGLSEVLISKLINLTGLNINVDYEPVTVEFGDRRLNGCMSQNFLKPKEEIVTIEHLYRQYNGESLAKALARFTDCKDRIEYTIEKVIKTTGLYDFPEYLSALLELDAFFLNEDRHTNNIAVIFDNEMRSFRLCPMFDFGMGLLSDTEGDYPMGEAVTTLMMKVKAKPFHESFDVMTDAMSEICPNNMKINLSKKEIINFMDKIELPYSEDVKSRVKEILRLQLNKYDYICN